MRNREWITVLGVGPVIVVDVITKAIVIEAILPGGRGAPCGGREGEAGVILGGGRMIGGGDGILAVAGRLCVGGHGRLVIDYATTIEELCLRPITSRIVGIGGVRVGGGVEGVCGEGEIRLGGRHGGGIVVDWGTTETG